MAKGALFPPEGAMRRHEECVGRWLAECGVPARKRFCAVSRGIFRWPQLMGELCREAGLPPPDPVLMDIYTLNVISITQYGVAATRRYKYRRLESSEHKVGSSGIKEY